MFKSQGSLTRTGMFKSQSWRVLGLLLMGAGWLGQAWLTVALMNNTSAPRAGAKNRSGVIRESLCFLQSGIY